MIWNSFLKSVIVDGVQWQLQWEMVSKIQYDYCLESLSWTLVS